MARGGIMPALLLVLLALPARAEKLTENQKAWRAARDRQPTTFVVPAEESDAAWERARLFIAAESSLPIQISDQTIIQTTAGQMEHDARPQITVARTRNPDGSWTFAVNGRNSNIFARDATLRIVQATAYFTQHGIPYGMPLDTPAVKPDTGLRPTTPTSGNDPVPDLCTKEQRAGMKAMGLMDEQIEAACFLRRPSQEN